MGAQKSDKQKILDVLDYWYFLDFMSQDALPEPQKRPEQKNYKNVFVTDVFDPFGSDVERCATPIECVDARIKLAKRPRGGAAAARGKGKKGAAENVKAAESLENNKELTRCIYVYLAEIPREAIVTYLWSKNNAAGDDKRVEKEVDNIAGAILGISSSGTFKSFEISPVLWVAGQKAQGRADVHEYEAQKKRITEDLAKEFGDRILSFEDLAKITSDYVAPILKHISEGVGLSDDEFQKCLDARLIGFGASDKPGYDYTVAFNSYFSADIAALRACFEKTQSLEGLEGGRLSLAAHYLEAGLDGERERERKGKRVDVLSTDSCGDERLRFYEQVLSYNSVPLGRWPSKYSLALMQQTAVDLAAGRLDGTEEFPANDIMSVNGPPGTGKTTLLKDVIAANVVEKAWLLSKYDRPDDAFERVALSKDYIQLYDVSQKCYVTEGVYRLKDEHVNDLGIIVCSTNNSAVENISKELPDAKGLLGAIGEEERRLFLEDELSQMTWTHWEKGKGTSDCLKRDLYFSYAAYNQFRDKQQGNPSEFDDGVDGNLHLLLSARLGKYKNKKAFAEALKKIPDGRLPKNGRSKRYEDAKRRFREQYQNVQRQLSVDVVGAGKQERESLFELEKSKAQRAKAEDDYKAVLSELFGFLSNEGRDFDVLPGDDSCAELDRCAGELGKRIKEREIEVAGLTSKVAAAKRGLEDARSSIFFLRPTKVSTAEDKVIEAQKDLDLYKVRHACDRLPDLLDQLDEITERKEGLERRLVEQRNLVQKCELVYQQAAEAAQDERKGAKALKSTRSADGRYDVVGKALVDDLAAQGDEEARKAAHLFSPVDGEVLMRERDLLFLRALQFTREFILSSNCMKSNLAYLSAYLGVGEKKRSSESGKFESIRFDSGDKKRMAPALFQALSVLTPVISTTFASAQKLFEDVEIKTEGRAPLGLLVIDEAGQAVPYAALGMLARSRRALVVGDPYQVEPVVNQEAKALRGAAAADIDLFYKGDTASVQKFADEANPYGQRRFLSEGGCAVDSWIGCPLVVHRRCISPMFDISNEVSYDGSMLNETRMLDPKNPEDKEKLDSFYMSSSQWLNVGGSERGNKDHYVEEQGERTLEIVIAAFERCIDKKRVPDLYLIAPFKTVVRGLRGKLMSGMPQGVDEKLWRRFVNDNIGTVHTFQGKEAAEVVFVLGCDRHSTGAIGFVNSNMVNVAASRAKHRLYVIGDYNAWQKNSNIQLMKRILDTAWVKHWKKYLDSKEAGEPDLEELRLAIEMLPAGESLPQASENDGEDGDVAYDTSSYLKNIEPCFTEYLFGRVDYEQLGFPPLSKLEEALACCADESGKNLAFNNLRQGMSEYGVHAEAREKLGGDFGYDWSGVFIMFGKAAELYLNCRALPVLKAALPESAVSNGQKARWDSGNLSLGECAKIIKKEKNSGLLAWRTGLEDAESVGADAQWWKGFSKSILGVADTRNESAHPHEVGFEEINCALAQLGLKEPEVGDVTVFWNDAVFDAAMKGTERTDVEEPVFASVDGGSADEGPAASSPSANEIVRRTGALKRADETELQNDGADAGSWLLGAESRSEDSTCVSFSKISKADKRLVDAEAAVKGKERSYATVVLGLLKQAELIQQGEVDGASGRFPTEKGAELGIRWRRYENEGKPPSTGIVFSPEAQEWLAANILELNRRHGRHD